MNKFKSAATALTLALTLAACGQMPTAPGETAQVAPDVQAGTLTAQATGTRAEILSRGKRWVDLGIAYNQGAWFEGYRQDCSGFLSMAWGIGTSAVTGTLGQYAVTFGSPADLQPGDAINNQGAGNAGHVVMFVGWASADDAARADNKRFTAYEENGGWGKAVKTTLTLKKRTDGKYTIAEYNASAPGPYVFQRSKAVPANLPTVGHTGDGDLTAGEGLMATDDRVYSPSRTFELRLQKDGNLVLYRTSNGQVMWATYTNGQSSHRLVMQNDGNLVLYSTTNGVLWQTGTQGNFGAYLAVQDDGNLVIYDQGRAIWWR